MSTAAEDIAQAERLEAETRKLRAETDKLMAEARKLAAEELKLDAERSATHRWERFAIPIGFAAIIAAVAATFTKVFFGT